MEPHSNETEAPSRIGDQSTSDVVVRLRTPEGRDDWLYCHSHVLVEKSNYFADVLSESLSTCQILDSCKCVEIYCQESDYDYYLNVLRLLYAVKDGPVDDVWNDVRYTLSCLRVAAELGCQQIVTACVTYLEAVPWEEAEEEEILRTVPGMGSQVEPILARLQSVNSSTIQFVTSSPPPHMNDLKSSAQEQLDYMLTEDDDAPLLMANDEIKFEVRECVKKLLARFNNLLETFFSRPAESVTPAGEILSFLSYLSDISWACQILGKLEMMRELVSTWTEASEKIVKAIEVARSEADMLEMRFSVIEVASKVLEAIGHGTVILPAAKRLHLVLVWLPFVRITKHLLNSVPYDHPLTLGLDGDRWQSLESAFVSIIGTLPSWNQAEILTEWLFVTPT